MEINTWADFGALSEEERGAYTPEELEALKTSITENETKAAEDRKRFEEDAAKARELAENYKIRAEKAEGELKKPKEDDKDLSSTDTIAIINAKVHEDDIADVVDYAKFKKISVAEALKTTTLKGVLAEKEEFRKSAEAANTVKRIVPTKVDASQVLDDTFNKDKIPEKGSDAAEKLFWARRGK